MTDTPRSDDEVRATFRAIWVDSLARATALVNLKEPPGISLNTSLEPQAMTWIGYIVSQWGMLEDQINTVIAKFRGGIYPVPEEMREAKPRREFRQRTQYVRERVQLWLPNERPEALTAYLKNLSRIDNFKTVRDHLVHGHYATKGNRDFSGVTVLHGSKEHTYSAQRLAATALGIGRCSGFFLTFDEWLSAPSQKTLLETHLAQTPE